MFSVLILLQHVYIFMCDQFTVLCQGLAFLSFVCVRHIHQKSILAVRRGHNHHFKSTVEMYP